jgi:DNA-binding NarL/FixJ family response regulator
MSSAPSPLALGDAPAGGDRYVAALGLFREIGNRWGIAEALLNLGRLAIAYALDAAAARLLHEALELALDTASAPQITAIVTTFAELIDRSGQRGWAAELVRLANDDGAVAEHYQSHSARLLAWSAAAAPSAIDLEQAIAATRAAAQAPPPVDDSRSTSAFPAGLTAREVEVLHLVAQGLTDAQVAEQLVLSRRTVHAHLASIYGKLQVNTRSAATRFAMEQGLA